jgi:integrase
VLVGQGPPVPLEDHAVRRLIGQDLVRTLPRRDVEIRDTKVPGFVIRCRKSGSHSYRVQLRRGAWETLGPVGILTPHDARELAQTKLAQRALAKHGLAEDPTTAGRKAPATLGVYVTQTYGPWVIAHHKTGADTVQRLEAIFADLWDVPLTELSGFAIEKWRTGRFKAGISAATVNRDLAALRGALSRAREWKLVRVHPMIDVKASKVDAREHIRYLTPEEETRLRAALTARDARRRDERARANRWRRVRGYPEWPAYGTYSDHVAPIVLLALNTGCRRGELLALTWGDVNLPAARLTVRAASSKSGLSRVIPLNAEARTVLTSWQPEHAAPASAVFATDDGAALQGLKSSWRALLAAARIQDFRFHDLRHHFASRLVQAGVDLNRLRALLGHADTKMVQRYAHLRDEDLAAAVAVLGRA